MHQFNATALSVCVITQAWVPSKGDGCALEENGEEECDAMEEGEGDEDPRADTEPGCAGETAEVEEEDGEFEEDLDEDVD